MTILNISIFTFLIGLGLFSYTIYERSSILSSEEQKPKTENLNYKNDKKVLETSQNEKSLLDIRNSLQSEILAKKHEIKEKYTQKTQLEEKINLLNFTKEELESDLFNLKLEISKIKLNLSKELKPDDQQNKVNKIKENDPLFAKNIELSNQIKQKNGIIIELEKQLLIAEEKNLKFSKTEFNKLKNDIETYKVNNKNFEQIINKQKEKILELKSANLIFEKELKQQNKETTPQKKSDGIVATFSGNLLYEPNKKRIILISSDGTQYTILQDDFPGDLVAKCGLPITNNSKNRCIATIVAELIVEDDQLILKGKEIKQITKNK
jgi:chromosome segregation ATPase